MSNICMVRFAMKFSPAPPTYKHNPADQPWAFGAGAWEGLELGQGGEVGEEAAHDLFSRVGGVPVLESSPGSAVLAFGAGVRRRLP